MELTGIKDIPWQNFRHAYGSAEDIPVLLDKMANSDNEGSEEASRELFEKICHQDIIEEVAVEVIEPVINILMLDREHICKWHPVNGLLNLLRCAGLNSDTIGFTPFKRMFKGRFTGKQLQEGEKRIVAINAGIRHRLNSRLQDLAALTANITETRARCQLLNLCAIVNPHSGEVYQMLTSLLSTAREEAVIANGLVALAVMEGQQQEKEIRLATSQHKLVNIARSLLLYRKQYGGMSAADWQHLEEACFMERQDYELFPWCDGAVAGLCAEMVRKSPNEDEALRFLKAMLEKHTVNSAGATAIDEMGPEAQEEYMYWGWTSPMLIANQLLALVFKQLEGAMEQVPLTALTPVQTATLAFLRQKDIELPNLAWYGLKAAFEKL